MRMINADDLGIGKAKREAFTVPEYADGWNAIIDIIDAAPTIEIDRPTRSQFKRMAVQLGYEAVPETPVDPPEEVKALTTPPLQNKGGAPKSGSLCFENTTTTEALNLVYSVLGSVRMAKLSVSWEA